MDPKYVLFNIHISRYNLLMCDDEKHEDIDFEFITHDKNDLESYLHEIGIYDECSVAISKANKIWLSGCRDVVAHDTNINYTSNVVSLPSSSTVITSTIKSCVRVTAYVIDPNQKCYSPSERFYIPSSEKSPE